MSSSNYPFYDEVFKYSHNNEHRLTPEQRTKKRMGLELNQLAVPISQKEIDIAKADFFEKGGQVTYLKSSGVVDRDIRKFVKEKFEDSDLVSDVSSKNGKRELE